MIFKPKLRAQASIEFHHSIVQAGYKAIENINNYPFQSCLFCIYFKDDFCRKWNAKPPSKVIVFGCDDFDDIDEIPF